MKRKKKIKIKVKIKEKIVNNNNRKFMCQRSKVKVENLINEKYNEIIYIYKNKKKNKDKNFIIKKYLIYIKKRKKLNILLKNFQ